MRMRGTWYIVPTPFAADGALDLVSLGRLVEAAVAWGVDGLTVMGVMAEPGALTADERAAALRTVFEAASGPEAVNVARLNAAAIQLVVSDVVMPEMSVAVLRRRLDALGVRAPVLYMSGHPIDAVAMRGVEAGDVAFLQKPFTPGDILFKVRRVLDGR